MTKRERDALYAGAEPDGPFVFDDKVAAVFADMIERSVPGYATLLGMIGMLAARLARPGLRCYDLGCSLGAATAAMRAAPVPEGCEFIAVDNAPAMVARARDLLSVQDGPPVDIREADIRDVEVRDAAIVVLNYTLQFVPVDGRLPLLRRICAGCAEGAALVVSEKIRGRDARQEALFTDLHVAFKRRQGYSELEISRKRQALEQVLIPDTLDEHQRRLLAAGFQRVELWFQCAGFVSLLAWK